MSLEVATSLANMLLQHGAVVGNSVSGACGVHTGVVVALLMCMTRAGEWFALLAVSQTRFWCMLEFGITAKPGPSACIGMVCSHYFNDLSSFKSCCSHTPVFFVG